MWSATKPRDGEKGRGDSASACGRAHVRSQNCTITRAFYPLLRIYSVQKRLLCAHGFIDVLRFSQLPNHARASAAALAPSSVGGGRWPFRATRAATSNVGLHTARNLGVAGRVCKTDAELVFKTSRYRLLNPGGSWRIIDHK